MSSGESVMGLLICMCKLTNAMSSCDETAEIKDVLDTEWVSEESSSIPSWFCNIHNHIVGSIHFSNYKISKVYSFHIPHTHNCMWCTKAILYILDHVVLNKSQMSSCIKSPASNHLSSMVYLTMAGIAHTILWIIISTLQHGFTYIVLQIIKFSA